MPNHLYIVKSLMIVPNTEGTGLSNCKWTCWNQSLLLLTHFQGTNDWMWCLGNSRPLWNNSFFMNDCRLFLLALYSLDVNWHPFNIYLIFIEVNLLDTYCRSTEYSFFSPLISIYFGNVTKGKRNVSKYIQTKHYVA